MEFICTSQWQSTIVKRRRRITGATAVDFAELTIVSVSELVTALTPDQVTSPGNQRKFLKFLQKSNLAIQADKLDKARKEIEKALRRTDGCALRGAPDTQGQSRDWITDCGAQIALYGLLNEALDALATP